MAAAVVGCRSAVVVDGGGGEDVWPAWTDADEGDLDCVAVRGVDGSWVDLRDGDEGIDAARC